MHLSLGFYKWKTAFILNKLIAKIKKDIKYIKIHKKNNNCKKALAPNTHTNTQYTLTYTHTNTPKQ